MKGRVDLKTLLFFFCFFLLLVFFQKLIYFYFLIKRKKNSYGSSSSALVHNLHNIHLTSSKLLVDCNNNNSIDDLAPRNRSLSVSSTSR
jgi:hypothetical protein